MPEPTSASRSAGRDGQKNEPGLVSGFSDPEERREFDQIWDQTVTVTGESTPQGKIEPEGTDALPSETREGSVAPSEGDVPPLASVPIPTGKDAVTVERAAAAPLEKSPVQPEAGQIARPVAVLRPEGEVNPAASRANDRPTVLPDRSGPAPKAGPSTRIDPVAENKLLSRVGSGQDPAQRKALLPRQAASDLSRPLPVPRAVELVNSREGSAAIIAGPRQPGSAGPGLPAEGSGSEGNFLEIDKQHLIGSKKRAGIGAALPGTDMRRASEKPSPNSMPSPIGTRLSTGSPAGSTAPVQLGLRPAGRAGVETDRARVEPTVNDRAVPGSSISESSPALPTPSGHSTGSLASLRPADAASVLEMVNRMADQMAARSQDRISMTLRFEDGGSIQIRMTADQGEIRTLFQTDLPGLEAALRQQWSQFSQDAQDRGTRFSSMNFTSADAFPERDRSQSGNPDQPEASVDDEPSASPDSAHPSTQLNRRPSAAVSRESGKLRAWV